MHYKRRNFGLSARFLACMLLLLVSSAARAQVNTESMRVSGGEGGFAGSVELALRVTSGNSDVVDAGNKLRLQYVESGHLAFLVSDIQYAIQKSNAFINRGFTHLRYNYRFRPRVTWEAFTQYEYNEFTRLFSRTLLGTGGRIMLKQQDSAALFLGTSYMYEVEHIDVAPESDDASWNRAHRWSSYLTVRWQISDSAFLVNSAYVQPRIDDFNDTRLLDEMEVQSAITKRLALSMSMSLRYDGRPPDGVKSTDLEIRNTLKIIF